MQGIHIWYYIRTIDTWGDKLIVVGRVTCTKLTLGRDFIFILDIPKSNN